MFVGPGQRQGQVMRIVCIKEALLVRLVYSDRTSADTVLELNIHSNYMYMRLVIIV